MGLFSTPKKTMDYSIWDQLTLKLRPEIEEQILARIPKIVPAEAIKEVFILGSITGYKWDDDSDIDVNIRVPLEEITDAAHVKRKATNGQLLINTKHPVNYFLQPYEKKSSWQDAYFGVYDVLNKVWASPPEDRATIRDPQKEFYFDLMFANQKLNAFRKLVETWKKYANLKNPTEHDKALAEKFFSEAKSFAQHIDEERKLEYKWGWGIPRKNWRNIVYKLIEHSDVGKEFEYLKELK